MADIANLLGKHKRKETFSGAEVDEKLLRSLVRRMKRKMLAEDEKFRKSDEAEKLRKLVEEKPHFTIKKAAPSALMKSKNSCFIKRAVAPRTPPKAKAPTSPIKT